MSIPGRYIILLGANTGDRFKSIKTAESFIDAEIGPIDIFSPVYETAPWGKTDQHAFLNRVVSGLTASDPAEIVSKSLAIEEKMGRKRMIKWEPRIIDIDLLFMDDQVLNSALVTVPHPMLHLRRFTLVPLFDIFPEFRHPVSGKTVRQLLEEVEDPLTVQPFTGKK